MNLEKQWLGGNLKQRPDLVSKLQDQQRDICTHVHPQQPWDERYLGFLTGSAGFYDTPLSLQRQTVVDVKLCANVDIFYKSLTRTKQQLLLACAQLWQQGQDQTVKFCEVWWRVYRHANGIAMSGTEVKTQHADPGLTNVSCLVAMLAAD